MHIVEVYFESGGFDFTLLKGGISVYMWNLSRKFVAAGHRVSLVTATNGKLDYLKAHYDLEQLPYRHQYRLPLALDPLVWGGRDEAEVALDTRVYRMTLEGIDVYFLDNEMLRLYPETCYPPYQVKGSDLGFYKPLAFQVDCISFIEHQFGAEPILVHAHEPYYQYLLPIAFKDDPRKIMVSTVQSNMPIDKKIYKPKLERLLALLGLETDLARFDDRLDQRDPLLACMREQLPATHLYYPYPDNYVNLLAPILEYSDYVDFLSPGQLRFYSSFADTPFEQLFGQLAIAEVIERNAGKLFVGWCAISDAWHRFDPATVDRAAVLRGLGLDPALPTFYHNARYAVEHKGQVEMMRAIDAVLARDRAVNFIVRCISGSGIDNPYFHEVKARYPHNIHLDWSMVSEATLMAYASAADFSLFPSKFEMDTFLIAQGEAMLCGAVPIATAQEGTSHFEHALPLSDPGATGLAVNRSFAEDDPLLAQALAERIAEAAALYRNDRPLYARLAANARAVAARFTWDMAARAHLDVFERAEADRLAGRPHGTGVAAPAAAAGDARAQFEQAFERADFALCRRLCESSGDAALAARIDARVAISDDGARVRYRHAGAAAVTLFARSGDAARFQRWPMAAGDGGFDLTLTHIPRDAELFFQLTLHSGRVCWDRTDYAAH
jgi:glycosyltransferase involved in cell wall biosynthesis